MPEFGFLCCLQLSMGIDWLWGWAVLHPFSVRIFQVLSACGGVTSSGQRAVVTSAHIRNAHSGSSTLMSMAFGGKQPRKRGGSWWGCLCWHYCKVCGKFTCIDNCCVVYGLYGLQSSRKGTFISCIISCRLQEPICCSCDMVPVSSFFGGGIMYEDRPCEMCITESACLESVRVQGIEKLVPRSARFSSL